jgi:lysine 2,3-aminomutase
VLISGGDPLSLSDARLVEIAAELRSIPSVEILRLCTRNPVTLPQRITPELLTALRPLHPIFVNTHFNHPRECTPEAALALNRLADAGFAVGNQMVLLRGINDDAATVEALNRWLLRQRCRPYYILQCDPVGGTAHLRTPVQAGVDILDALRGRVSGLGVPSSWSICLGGRQGHPRARSASCVAKAPT